MKPVRIIRTISTPEKSWLRIEISPCVSMERAQMPARRNCCSAVACWSAGPLTENCFCLLPVFVWKTETQETPMTAMIEPSRFSWTSLTVNSARPTRRQPSEQSVRKGVVLPSKM
jgi:hypothetical protein